MVNAAHRKTGAGRVGLPLLAAALALGVAVLPASAYAAGETNKKTTNKSAKQKKQDAAPQVDTAAIQRAYAAGTKAFESGDMAGAEQQLCVALAGGGLPNAQMARALYFRGSAYRQLGRPAQAISDLTTAIWLKGGLPDTLKKKATEERQLAYREAGLGDNPPPIGAAPLDQSTATASAGGAKPGAQVVDVSQQSSFWNFLSLPTLPSLTGGSSSAAPAQQTAQATAVVPTSMSAAIAPAPAAAPVSGFAAAPEAPAAVAQTSWDTQTATTSSPPPAQAQIVAGYAPASDAGGFNTMPGAAAAPQSPASNPLAGAGSAVSGFFGNIFGSGTSGSQASAEASPVTTGSTAQPSGWGPETTVTTAQTSSMVQRGPDAPTELPWGGPQTATAPAPSKKTKTASVGAAGGAYKLQVAAVRSREEAEKLAQSLRTYQAVQNGTVTPEIDEAVIGSMGTFYRVRLGPYADAAEPGQLCKTLKPQGFDCLVVTQ